MRVSRCTASEKPHRYGRTASSGPVVGNDPVNRTDPLGLEDDDIVVIGNPCRVKNCDVRNEVPVMPTPTVQRNVSEPRDGCSASRATAMARANAGASNLGPVTFDSANEVSLLGQYFRGDTTPYQLSNAEMAQARSYVSNYGNRVLGSSITKRADGLTERSVFFGKIASAAPLLDGLLGTARGVFSGDNLVGLRDTFNFDFKDRGGYPYGVFANLGVAMVRLDAASCAGNVSIPVSGGVQ